MANIILLYNLQPGVSREAYEQWQRTVDYPAMRGLKRVASFVNHRVTGLLMGEGAPSKQYVEIFDVPDLPGFLAEDMGGPVVQQIMGAFMGYVADPEFLIAEPVV